jgi:hypothetical protein
LRAGSIAPSVAALEIDFALGSLWAGGDRCGFESGAKAGSSTLDLSCVIHRTSRLIPNPMLMLFGILQAIRRTKFVRCAKS